MTRPRNPILKSDWLIKWPLPSRDRTKSGRCGNVRTGYVRYANRRLPNKPAGINIIWCGGSMAALMHWTTGFYFTRTVIGRFIVKEFLLNCCVLHRAFEWLEP